LISGLNALNFHDAGLKFVVGVNRPVLDAGLVGVDGVDRIFEDLGDLFVVIDAHADEGKDAKIDVEGFVLFEVDLVFFFEQGVESGYEVGENAQEDGVEAAEEFFFFLLRLYVVDNKSDVFKFAICDLLVEGLFESFEFYEELRVQAKEVADIFFFYFIGFFQFSVDEALGGVGLGDQLLRAFEFLDLAADDNNKEDEDDQEAGDDGGVLDEEPALGFYGVDAFAFDKGEDAADLDLSLAGAVELCVGDGGFDALGGVADIAFFCRAGRRG